MAARYSVVRNHLGQSLVVAAETAAAFRRYKKFDWLGLSVIERALSRMDRPIALDIGANIGNHTLVMAHYCEEVHSFEPLLRTRTTLKDNVLRNGADNVFLYDFGLSDRNDTLELFISPDANAGATTLVRELARNGGGKVRVPVRVGDAVLEDAGVRRVDLIKVDVEGFEARAILGLRRTIARDRPLVFLEWNNPVTRSTFIELSVFTDIFPGWECLAIEDSCARSRFARSLSGRLRRICAKLLPGRRAIFEPFDPAKSYGNIVMFEASRAWALQPQR